MLAGAGRARRLARAARQRRARRAPRSRSRVEPRRARRRRRRADRVEPARDAAMPRRGAASRRARRAGARLDALIDAIAPLALEAPVSGELGAGAPAAHAPRRQQAVPDRRAERRDRRVGAAARRPALRRVPGRRAAGQPHRRAQRDRVFGVRAEDAGLRRAASARWPTSPTCSTSWRARASSTSSPAQHDAQLAVHAARARRRLVGRATSSSTPARHGFVPGVGAGPPGAAVARTRRAADADADLRLAGRAGRRPEPGRGARADARASTCRRPTRRAEPFAAWQPSARALARRHGRHAGRRQRPAARRCRPSRDRQRARPAVRSAARRATWPPGRPRRGGCSAEARRARARARASARTPRPRSDARRSCGRTAPWLRRQVSATARLCTISGASAPSMCTAEHPVGLARRPAASCSVRSCRR